MKLFINIFLALGLLYSNFIAAEILEPIKWETSAKEVAQGEFEITFTAKIDKKWHLYSQHIKDGGPIPTTINFDESAEYKLIGKTNESGEAHEKFEPMFEMDLKWFENEASFVQKVKMVGEQANVKGYINYMTCDDSRCLPPSDYDFEILLVTEEIGIEENDKGSSLWTIFILGFGGGLLALLTPCVFPMIPLTVSFFTKQSENKAKGISNAIIYGISIIVIYVLLGFIVTKIFGADALNAFSTNVWLNLFFFIIFVVFAVSFFGAFEITLPNSWISKTDAASDKGGLIGIFFMALTLTLVSFSCTGPIIGTLLVEAAVNGGVIGPVIGMAGFSSALALPFALFAAFPGWLNSLPKSGGWLNSVKVTLGFLELAAALKFLSNADLVTQSWILTRELFLALWIIIFALLGLYLLGFIKFSHDSEIKYVSVPRLFTAILSFAFTMYLVPGLWGAPLKLISGFPPPMFYTEWPQGGGTASIGHSAAIAETNEHCPHNLNCFHDYDEGMAYAKKEDKPVMIDFTGWACVNCRKMEENVWSDPEILKILQNEYVLISLYVDEKEELPEAEQVEVEIGGKTKKIKTVGNKWSYLQTSRFGNNSQPWYVLQDHNENLLVEPQGYTPAIEDYKAFLESGLSKQ